MSKISKFCFMASQSVNFWLSPKTGWCSLIFKIQHSFAVFIIHQLVKNQQQQFYIRMYILLFVFNTSWFLMGVWLPRYGKTSFDWIVQNTYFSISFKTNDRKTVCILCPLISNALAFL